MHLNKNPKPIQPWKKLESVVWIYLLQEKSGFTVVPLSNWGIPYITWKWSLEKGNSFRNHPFWKPLVSFQQYWDVSGMFMNDTVNWMFSIADIRVACGLSLPRYQCSRDLRPHQSLLPVVMALRHHWATPLKAVSHPANVVGSLEIIWHFNFLGSNLFHCCDFNEGLVVWGHFGCCVGDLDPSLVQV